MPTQMEKTLLNSLFTFEQCKVLPQRKDVYFTLFDRIFPNADGYRVFLSTTDYNEKVEMAKKLLGQLCFESNYPPPVELLSDIATQESDPTNRSTTKKYIPQDHYAHILNLYILGLYIFFCHPSINREIIYHFMDNRNESNNFNRLLNSTKDFLSSWKYFCLYHDISYPIEFRFKYDLPQKPTEDMRWTINKFKKEYLQLRDLDANEYECFNIYNSMGISLQKNLAIEAISKLVVIMEVITDKANHTFDRIFKCVPYTYSSRDESIELNSLSLSEKFAGYVSLEKIYTHDHLKLLYGVFDMTSIVSVIFDACTEIPIAINYYDSEKSDYVQLYAIEDIDKDLIRSIEYQLTNEDAIIDEMKRIRYYVKDPIDAMKKSMPNDLFEISTDDILNISKILMGYEQISKEKYIKFHKIKNYVDLCEYMYQQRYYLEKFCNEFLDLSHTSRFEPVFYADKIRNNARNTYAEFLKKDFADIIKKSISDTFAEDDNMQELTKLLSRSNRSKQTRNSKISEYINTVFDDYKVQESKREITKSIIDEVDSTIKAKLDSYNIVTRLLFSVINNTGLRLCSSSKEMIWITKHGVCSDVLLNSINDNTRLTKTRAMLDEQLKQKYSISLNDLEQEYYYVPFYDHGINSSLIYLAMSNIYMMAISDFIDNPTQFSRLIGTLIWPVEENKIGIKLFENYESVIFETYRSIIYHNIYSKAFCDIFKLKQWETDMSDNPFTFFCILSDSLQRWGRRKFYDYRSVDYRSEIAMDDYDISIEKDTILLSVSTYTRDVESVKRAMINDLDEFLKNCTHYLGIRINELI